MMDRLRMWWEKMPWGKKMPPWAWWAVALVLLGVLALVWDTGSSATPSVNDPFAPVEWTMFVGIFLKLGVVIALIYLGLYLLKKWRYGGVIAPGRQMTLLESLRLSQKQAVHLLRLEDRYLVIGATDQNVSLLAQWKDGGEWESDEEPDSFANLTAKMQ